MRYVNFVPSSCCFFSCLWVGLSVGYVCFLLIVVYATTIQVNEFQDGLLGNRCNRSLGLTLKLTVFDVTPTVIP